jgi:LruC domain-containing protein
VHLPDNPPTALVNPDYFDTEHDNSNPETGRYYKTENNLPWAINVPSEFDYPVEKAVIIQAYLHFATWAESSGSQYADWYLNNTGYRNNDVIYQVP